VYSRVDLSRTATRVVALFLTAISAKAVAREFRTADARSEPDPAVRALRHRDRPIAENSGGTPQIRVLHWRQPGGEKALGAEPGEPPDGPVLAGFATGLADGAENDWPAFVTTDHHKYAGYHSLPEHTMSPEIPVASQKAWQGLSMADRKIFGDAAIRRKVE
jgi:TRAP-type C4-dicarboxylate transport system substrate-binding protein